MPPTFTYVYILTSAADPTRHYTGMTSNLPARLAAHNSGLCLHTAKHAPWEIMVAIALPTRAKAVAFEKYLKTHSGRVFAKRHF